MKPNNAIVRVNKEKDTSRTQLYESWTRDHLSIANSLIFGDTIFGRKTIPVISDQGGNYFPNPHLAEQVMYSLFLRVKNSNTCPFPFPFLDDEQRQYSRKCFLAISNAYRASAQIETQRARDILRPVLEGDPKYKDRRIDFIVNGEIEARGALEIARKRYEERKGKKEKRKSSWGLSRKLPFLKRTLISPEEDLESMMAKLQYETMIHMAEKLLDRATIYRFKARQLESSLAKTEAEK